jgi:pentatricopeptide repeat protein
MHVQIMIEGLSLKDVVIGNALVDMYCKCGSLAKAQEVFDEVPTRDIVTWNALLTGYEQHGQAEKALNHIEEMCASGFSPDAITYVCSLKACGGLRDLQKGEKLHAEILKNESHRTNVAIGTSLVDMYARCGELMKVQDAFEDLRNPTVTAWNVLISGYVRCELNEEAMACFRRMRSRCFSPDAMTFVPILKACGSVEAVEKGREMHAEIARQGLIDENSILGTALVDMYAKCGAFAKAVEVFDAVPVQDVFCWNVLIARNAQYGYCEEALDRFEEMQLRGDIGPDAVTFIGVLKACSNLGTVTRGQEAHIGIVKAGLPTTEILIGNALVDMYANCGALEEAQLVFDALSCRD